MGVPRFPGLVDRITERMRAQGYADGDRALWGKWAKAHGFAVNLVQGWMLGMTPTFTNLERLARALDCDLAWLLLGDARYARWDGRERRRPPIAGGSAAAEPRPVAKKETEVPLIRREYRRGVWAMIAACAQLVRVAQLVRCPALVPCPA